MSKQDIRVVHQSSFPFIGLLTLLFIGLKLTNHIDWSWWLVLAPIWGSVAVGIGFIVLAAALVAWAESRR